MAKTKEWTIRSRIEHLGFNTAQIASRAGVKRPYISQLQNGKKEPPYYKIPALANALNMTPDEFREALARTIATSKK